VVVDPLEVSIRLVLHLPRHSARYFGEDAC
jgi:hypothetical protein